MGLDITGIGAIFDFGSKVIDKIFPDQNEAAKAKLAMFELQQKGELAQLDNDFKLAIEQIKTNAVEAQNASIFVSGWRPFIGWICGFSLGYNYIFMPLFTYCARWYDKVAPVMPVLDNGELTTLLFGMLGLGIMRTYEKKEGVASK
ncbi:MAG: holin family protein [Clostridia bacterium]|jgi:hypothetical protein